MAKLRPFTLILTVFTLAGCQGKQPPSTPQKDATTPVSTSAPKPPKPAAEQPATTPFKAQPSTDACADCHPDEVDGFLSTGMGRSWYRPGAHPAIENFDPKAATVTHKVTGAVYRAYVDADGRWWQEERQPGTEYVKRVEVEYVVGSGNHTRSYIGTQEGELVELPLTWYSGRKIWDMSPGYEGRNHFRFSRPIKPQCAFCHNDLSPLQDDTLSGYRAPIAEGIGCGRCHGDGTEHVALREAGKGTAEGQADPSIINPARLSNHDQLRICQQCHLTGESRVLLDGQRWDQFDLRKTRLADYMSIYLYEGDDGPDFGIASHGKRLSLSACFKQSQGQLTCTKCHDPHRKDLAKSRFVACASCHQPDDCGDEHGKGEKKDCAKCHMYQGDTSDIPHVTFTDHFIRKTPRSKGEGLSPQQSQVLIDALAVDRTEEDPAKAATRTAIAHAESWRFGGRRDQAPIAERKLTAAIQAGTQRPQAYYELSKLYSARGRPDLARDVLIKQGKLQPKGTIWRMDLSAAYEDLRDFKKSETVLREVIALRPNHRMAWGNLANSLQRQKRYDDAEAAYAKTEAITPGLAATANNRGHNAAHRGRRDEARRWFEEALKRDGTDAMGHFNLGSFLLQDGDVITAKRHIDQALRLNPDFPLALWMRGRIHLENGDLGAARDDLDRLLLRDPRNAAAAVDRALVAWRAGDQMDAQRVLVRAQSATPGDPLIQRALREVRAGQPPTQAR